MVVDRLRRVHPQLAVEIVTVRTEGDRDQALAVSEFPADGVFVRALEAKLVNGEIDLAVHSLKDVPSALLPGLSIVAFLSRDEVADALVTRTGGGFRELPPGARVGTGSARRRALVLAERPDVLVEPVRGNVDTRLRKLRDGEYDALVLALTGIERLGLPDVRLQRLDPNRFVPAPGQGTLAVEARAASPCAILAAEIDDPEARVASQAERAFVGTLGMGCVLPAGAFAVLDGDEVVVRGILADDADQRVIRDEVRGPREQAEQLGSQLAGRLMAVRGGGAA